MQKLTNQFTKFSAAFAVATALLFTAGSAHALESGRFSSEIGQRQYRFYSPAGYDPASGRELPLVVFLHGCGQTPEDFLTGTEMAAVADRNQFFVLLPMQERIYNSMACWNWYLPEHQRRSTGEPGIIAGMVEKIAREHKVDRTRIYIAGFSSGAAMVANIASCYPDLFAAAAIHSGPGFHAAQSLPEAFQAMNSGGVTEANRAGDEAYACSGLHGKTMPVAIFQGSRDTVVNPVNAQQVFDQFVQFNDLADDGRDNDSINTTQATSQTGQVTNGYAYRVDTVTFRTKPLVRRFLVQSMPHAWSGGTGFQYMDPKGPEASELLYNFFSQHRRTP